MTGLGEQARTDPEIMLGAVLAGRRYDDAYPPEDLNFLNCFAPDDERSDARCAPRVEGGAACGSMPPRDHERRENHAADRQTPEP